MHNIKKNVPILILLLAIVLAACATQQPTTPEVDNTLPTPPPPEANQDLPTPDPVEPTPPATATTAAVAPTATAVSEEPLQQDPAVFLGAPDAEDNFDTNDNWTGFENECFSSQVTGGQYVITAKGLKDVACWEVSALILENFYIETLVNMPQTCDPQDRFGVFFRTPDDQQGYLYGLSCAGEVSLTRWDGQETTEIIQATGSTGINVGAGQQNRMGLAAYGSSYLLYVNGFFVAAGEDSSYLAPGKIGYFVRAATEQPFTAAYDYLKIWNLDDIFYPPDGSPPPNVTPIPPPEGSGAVVTAITYINVRSGPGTTYPIYGVAPPGSQAAVIGISEDGGWWNISVQQDVIPAGNAWVSADYVIAEGTDNVPVVPPPAVPPEVDPPPPTGGAATVTSTDAINVRNGPDNQCTSYGVAAIGASATAIGVSADGLWYQIQISTDIAADGLGWVNGNYLLKSNTENLPVTASALCP